jgi:acetyl-CoA C-acetyltransferase
MNQPYIIGWGHTPFGKFDAVDPEQLVREAIEPALHTAGLQPRDIDGIFVGHFNGGFLPQDFTSSIVALAIPELRHVPAVRTENACATGSSAIWAALDAVQAGRVKRALVVGFEIMNAVPTPKVAETLLRCSYVKEEGTTPGGFAGVFGKIAASYFERFGDQSDALASISAKNHANGVHNLCAHAPRPGLRLLPQPF